MISSGRIDLLVNYFSYTMDRDIYMPSIDTGLSFVTPYHYETSHYGGWSHFVHCAEQDTPDKEDCKDLHVCVSNGTRYYDLLAYKLSKNQLSVRDGNADTIQGFITGECNAMVDSKGGIRAVRNGLLASPGVDASHVENDIIVGASFGLEPMALCVREDDVQWRDFVFWVFEAIHAGERYGITQNSSSSTTTTPSWAAPWAASSSKGGLSYATTNVFGEGTKYMLQDAVAAAGNFDEIDNLLDPLAFPLKDTVGFNDGTEGIMLSLALGKTEEEGPGPHPDGTLATILQRGQLRCAVRLNRPGFAERHSDNSTIGFAWSGMDVDYCRAVHGAIFATMSEEEVELVEVVDDEEGFKMLHDGDVDVYAGVMMTMERDVLEPSTKMGFAFSRPYFYNVSALLAK